MALTPRVSVVVPLYNKAPYVEASVRSVLGQDMPDFELIVVDDGSTDGGDRLVEALGDERLRLLRLPKGGVSAARNGGVAASRADRIAFLDADDLWEPGFLGRSLDALDRHPAAVASFCAFGEGRTKTSRLPASRREIVVDDYPAWFMRYGGRGLWCSNSLVRRGALEAAGLFPLGVQNGEDTDTWFRVAFEGPVLYLPELLCTYTEAEAGRLSRAQGATRPLALRSIDAELGRGRLRGKRARSAEACLDYFHLAYAAALAMEGRRREAFAEALVAKPRPRLWRSYARTAIALATGR